MNIIKNQKGTNMEITLEGRLDTMTSPELDAALKQLPAGIESLTLDFAELEYVSSAGLRVLLAAYKVFGGKGGIKIRNVNELVKEVFEVTGVDDILVIE